MWTSSMILCFSFLLGIVPRMIATSSTNTSVLSVTVTVHEGSSLSLTCANSCRNTKSNCSYVWSKDNVQLNGTHNESLDVKKVGLSDAGTYVCITNQDKSHRSSKAMLHVLKKGKDDSELWRYIACGAFGVIGVLLLVCLALCLQIKKCKNKQNSYLVGDGKSRGKVNASADVMGTAPYAPIQLPLPGLKLPLINTPLTKEDEYFAKYSNGIRNLVTNGYIGSKTSPPMLTRANHASDPGKNSDENYNDYGKAPPAVILEANHDRVYESCRDNENLLRPRCSSEPIPAQEKARYATLGVLRNDSLHYSTLDAHTRKGTGSPISIGISNDDELSDTLMKRRMDKPYPAPRPKKVSLDSSHCILEESDHETGDLDHNEIENEDEVEDGDGYVKPQDTRLVEGDVTKAGEDTPEPKYINAKPLAPNRRERNLYDAVHRRTADDDDESYYLKLRNSIYSKELCESLSAV